jgi:hypothetical protein
MAALMTLVPEYSKLFGDKLHSELAKSRLIEIPFYPILIYSPFFCCRRLS